MKIDLIIESEIKKFLIKEGREKTIDEKSRKIIQQILGWSDEEMNSIAVDDNGKPILTMKGATQTYAEYFQRQVANQYIRPISVINKDAYKFEIGASRILFGELHFLQQAETEENTQFKRILKIIAQSHIDEYTENFEHISNGKVDSSPLDFEVLYDRFIVEVKQQSDDEKNEVNSFQYESPNHEYEIVYIPDFETSSQYFEYTNPNSRWCLTYGKNHWDSYNPDGSKKVYFVLEKGFENIPCERTEGFPLDKYGLSMLCIQMDEFGNMTHCTTRWNHDNPDGDQALTPLEVSKVLGGSVYKLCPSYSKEELLQKGLIPFSMIPELIKQGKMQFDAIADGGNGLKKVKFRRKYNFIQPDGNLCSTKWFDDGNKFSGGYAKVSLNNKCNYINTEGQLVSQQWFDGGDNFANGYAWVSLNDKCNYINTEGQLVSQQWFDGGRNFENGYALVYLNGKDYYLRIDGVLCNGDKQPINNQTNESYRRLKQIVAEEIRRMKPNASYKML